MKVSVTLAYECNAKLSNFQNLNRQAATIKESGSGSVPDLARQLTSKRIAVTIVRKQMDLYEVIIAEFFLSCGDKRFKHIVIVVQIVPNRFRAGASS